MYVDISANWNPGLFARFYSVMWCHRHNSPVTSHYSRSRLPLSAVLYISHILHSFNLTFQFQYLKTSHQTEPSKPIHNNKNGCRRILHWRRPSRHRKLPHGHRQRYRLDLPRHHREYSLIVQCLSISSQFKQVWHRCCLRYHHLLLDMRSLWAPSYTGIKYQSSIIRPQKLNGCFRYPIRPDLPSGTCAADDTNLMYTPSKVVGLKTALASIPGLGSIYLWQHTGFSFPLTVIDSTRHGIVFACFFSRPIWPVDEWWTIPPGTLSIFPWMTIWLWALYED